MKKINFFLATIMLLIVGACGTETTPRSLAIEKIKKCESQMHTDITLNDTTATSAINAYHDFVQQFPTDNLSPDFLFKAAEIATASKQYDKALADYKQIVSQYPSYQLYQESYFLQASLLDNYMQQDGAAKMVYEQIIEKFPKSKYAADSKDAINNLGLSDQELIDSFTKKNGN